MASVSPTIIRWPINGHITEATRKVYVLPENRISGSVGAYKVFPDSCGYKLNRSCPFLGKFVTMPIWLVILLGGLILTAFLISSIIFGLITGLRNSSCSSSTSNNSSTATSVPTTTISNNKTICLNRGVYNFTINKCSCYQSTYGDYCEYCK